MTGQTARLGTGLFDIKSGSSQPPVAKKRILKSKTSTAQKASMVGMSLEYINPNVWSWNGPRETTTVQKPFEVHEAPQDVDIAMNDFSRPYEVENASVHRKRYYKPTSPKMVLESK